MASRSTVIPSDSKNSLKLTKTIRYGFPDSPSCMAYDCVQDLFAFGSLNGQVIILGHPGLEKRLFLPCGVELLQFGINKGIMAVYCSNCVCYIWSIRASYPKLISEFKLPPKERATIVYWPYNSSIIYVGTSSGNVLFVAVKTKLVSGEIVSADTTLCQETVYWNKVVITSHGFRRDHPGEIKCIEEHPVEPFKILIVYSNGMVIIWNLKTKEVEYREIHNTIEGATWYDASGKSYVLCNSEGKILNFNCKKKEEKILYQCRGNIGSITNLQSYNIKTSSSKWLIFVECVFSKNVSEAHVVVLGEKGVISSIPIDQSIVDVSCIPTSPFRAEKQTPKALVILQSDKLEVLDLEGSSKSDSQPQPFIVPFSFEYLTPSSCITYLNYGGKCSSQALVDSLIVLKSKLRYKTSKEISSNKWPFLGGGCWSERSNQQESLPMLLVTSHETERDSIKLWLSYPDILEYLFTIETARLFPLNYSSTQAGAGNNSGSCYPAVSDIVHGDHALDVKFVSVNITEETLVFVNMRGNVLVYKFSQLQPDHETPNSMEIVLNNGELSNSEEMRSRLPWKFWVNSVCGDPPTQLINLLHHVSCLVYWEDTINLVPVHSAAYNHQINMLLLGTHIAMVLVDTKNNGSIVIDTLHELKSMGLSNISNCKKRTLVESKTATNPGNLKRFFKKKSDKPLSTSNPIKHEVTPFCSSVVDIVYFTTKTSEQPSLTLWMGTASGDLVMYNAVINNTDKNIMAKCSDILLNLKEPLSNLIFLTEYFQIIQTNVKWTCNTLSTTDSTDESILNYAIIQTKNTVKCFGFPCKKLIPISQYTDKNKVEIINSFFAKFKGDKPCIIVMLDNGSMSILSLPNLYAIASISADLSPSDFITMRFNDTGEGVCRIGPAELQRIVMTGVDEEDGVDYHCPPSAHVPLNDPVKSSTGWKKFKMKTTDDMPSNRSDWFSPQHDGQSYSRGKQGRKFSHSLPSYHQHTTTQSSVTSKPSTTIDKGKIDVPQSSVNDHRLPNTHSSTNNTSNNPFERTAQALDERGLKLNKTLETTNKLVKLAEAYAHNMASMDDN